MRSSSPARSIRSSASRRSACGAGYWFQPSDSSAESVLPMLVVHVGDGVVAVDERPGEQAVLEAPHLVLDLEQLARIARIDDPLEAPLRLVGLHRDEAALLQPAVRARKFGDIDLDVVAVVFG